MFLLGFPTHLSWGLISVRLLSVELQGFKSFVDRIKIPFEDGVNAIVGPNGCGKSNIVDAFLWVLGEQSAKSLRADKMTDVIFAGTKARKAVNFAEVTLTFSNEEGKFPLPFKEIAVTRRLYRSAEGTGESLFLINKKQVRLRDVHELFLHTGLGKEAFAVIGQGRVEEEISQSPFERRKMFDELAGVSRPLLKRKETLDRLKKSSDNVEKARIKFDEVYRQLDELKKQADQAEEYKKTQERLDLLHRVLHTKKSNKLKNRHDELTAKITSLEALKIEKQSLESTIHRDVSILKEQVELSWKALSNSTQEVERVKGQKNLSAQLYAQADERIKKATFRRTHLSQDLAKAKKFLDELTHSKQETQKKVFQQDHLLKQLKTLWEKSQEEQKEIEGQSSQLFTHLKSAQSFLIQKEREASQLEVRRNGEKKRSTDILQRVDALKKESQQLIIDPEDEVRIEQKKKDRASLLESIESAKGELQKLHSGAQQHEDRLKEVRADRLRIQTMRMSAQTKHATLGGLRNDHVGLDAGVKKLVQLSRDQKSQIYQKVRLLADIFKEDKEFFASQSLAAFSFVFSSFLVVERVEDLQLLVECAEKNKIQHYTCFCLELLGMDLTEWKKWIQSIPVIMKIGALDSSTPLALLDKGRFLQNGILFGIGSEGKNSLLIGKEMEVLQEEIDILVRSESQAVTQENEISEALESVTRLRRSLDQKMRSEEMRLLEVNKLLFDLERVLTHKAERLVVLEKESNRLQDELHQSQVLLTVLEKELFLAQELFTAAKNELMKQEAQSSQAAQKRASHQAILNQRETEYRTLENETRSSEKHLIEVSSKLQRCLEECERLETELKHIEQNLSGGDEKRKELFIELERIEVIVQEAEGRLDTLKKEAQEKKQSLQTKESALESVRKEVESLRNAHSQASKEVALVESDLAKYHDLAHSSEEEASLFDTQPESRIQQEIVGLETFSKEAGQINFRAIDDYNDLKNKQDFAIDELQDLEKSRDALIELIQQIEKDANLMFEKSFSEVRQAFQTNFTKLFGGGDADLLLVAPHAQDGADIEVDPFMRGVEIIAKPPGKEMRTLQLLSGGEKTMTALALLMAFFQVRPSPCCILDEVDAPLDEANVIRFTDLLRSFAKTAQFILITHNKKTMATCERLIGVSMEQKGVSTILELQLVS